MTTRIWLSIFLMASAFTILYIEKAAAEPIHEYSDPQAKVKVVQLGSELLRIEFDAGAAGDLPLPENQTEIVEPSIIHMIGNKQTSNSARANEIVRHIKYFSQQEPRDFSFYIDSQKTENGHNFIGFCVDYGTAIIHVTCSRSVLDLSELDFKELMKKNEVDFKLIQDRAADEAAFSQAIAPPLLFSIFSNDDGDEPDFPTPEDWAEYVEAMLQELCQVNTGDPICTRWGTTSTYYPSSGIHETHGYYELIDGSGDNNYLPRGYFRPLNSGPGQPPGGGSVIEI